jgi:hypothetical protein
MNIPTIPEMLANLNPFKDNNTKYLAESFPSIKGPGLRVDHILNEFNRAKEFEEENLARESKNWNLYSGYDNGQYPADILAQLREEGRNPFQGNFIRGKVDGLAGSIVKNFFDLNFEAIDGKYIDLCRIIKELMLSDKELLDWNDSYLQIVVAGLVYRGVEEMYVSTEYSPLGNIGFRFIMPGHIILDPNWITAKSKDLRRAWKMSYLTAEQIKEKYNTREADIDAAIAARQFDGLEYDLDAKDEGFPYFNANERYGSQYRVIEFHHMETKKKKIEVVASSGLVVPDVSDEEKKEWAIYNGVTSEDDIIHNEITYNEYYVTTICPELSRNFLLEDRKAKIQIGRLPFFPWSSCRINGKNGGLPDLLESIQVTYNKRESMIDHMISTSANGAHGIDPDIVDSDMNKMAEIEKNWNTSSYRFWTSPGKIASGRNFFAEVPRTNIDYGVVNEIGRLLDLGDRVSKLPAATDARSEGSEESGILFARKQMQSDINHAVLYRTLEQLWNDKGESYLLAAKQLYSGIYRTFLVPGKDNILELNKTIYTDEGPIIVNDISALPRMKVAVTQSPQGTTMRAIDRAMGIETLRVIGPENPLLRARTVKKIVSTLDTTSAEAAQMAQDAELEAQLARETLKTQLLNLQATQMQLTKQLQEPQQQMIQPGQEQGQPQEQGGMSDRSPGNPSMEPSGQNQTIAQS